MTDAPPPYVLHEFQVMGTTAQLLLRADEASARPVFERAEAELHRLNALLTRFDSSSELERLNDAREAAVGDELLELLQHALEQHRATGGRFDVGVGARLVAAGYDRTWRTLDQLDDTARAELGRSMLHGDHESAPEPSSPSPSPVPEPFSIDGRRVTLRDDIRIDLGGIAKGWASDRIARMLAHDAGCSSLASLGGDIAVQVAQGDAPWPVGMDTGADGRLTLALAYGGLATSAWRGRAWRRSQDGALAHHVIDPRTGEPARTDVAQITVIASSCMQAEVWATSLMLAGSERAEREANELGLATVIVRSDDSSVRTGSLAGT